MNGYNIYYSPEKFGLTVVDEDERGGSYEFDTIVLWQHEDGTYYWAEDNGCSCPTPFESFRSLADLEQGRSGYDERRRERAYRGI